MWLADVSIRRPVFATMLIISLVVLGLVSFGRLGVDLFPEVEFPYVSVTTALPGASVAAAALSALLLYSPEQRVDDRVTREMNQPCVDAFTEQVLN